MSIARMMESQVKQSEEDMQMLGLSNNNNNNNNNSNNIVIIVIIGCL